MNAVQSNGRMLLRRHDVRKRLGEDALRAVRPRAEEPTDQQMEMCSAIRPGKIGDGASIVAVNAAGRSTANGAFCRSPDSIQDNMNAVVLFGY